MVVRQRAKMLREARASRVDGGSSHRDLDDFIIYVTGGTRDSLFSSAKRYSILVIEIFSSSMGAFSCQKFSP